MPQASLWAVVVVRRQRDPYGVTPLHLRNVSYLCYAQACYDELNYTPLYYNFSFR